MPKVSSNDSRESGKSPTASSSRLNNVLRPGLPEGIVDLIVFSLVGYGAGSQLSRLRLDPVVYGLALAALSVVAPFAGFAAAVLLRIRSLHAFGERRVSWRWLLIGVGAGVAAFVVKGFAVS